MNRRDFLRLSAGPHPVLDVSCEALYMNYLDSEIDGTTRELLERLSSELRRARNVRLCGAFWLERKELKEALEPLLAEVRAHGGVVEYV